MFRIYKSDNFVVKNVMCSVVALPISAIIGLLAFGLENFFVISKSFTEVKSFTKLLGGLKTWGMFPPENR